MEASTNINEEPLRHTAKGSIASFVFAFAILLASISIGLSSKAHAISVTQLGFALDGSGSISASEFALQTSGLAQAIAALPTDSTVEITIVQFAGSGATVEQTPIVIDSLATRDAVVAMVNAISQQTGGTPMSAGIQTLVSQMISSPNFGDPDTRSIINISTDGFPNSTSATADAAAAALTDGIDALTAEAVGSGAAVAFLQEIVFNPQGGLGTGTVLATDPLPPNPLTTASAWVAPVSSFDAYAAVIGAKVQAVAQPATIPEPGTIALLGVGMFGLGLLQRRRRPVI